MVIIIEYKKETSFLSHRTREGFILITTTNKITIVIRGMRSFGVELGYLVKFSFYKAGTQYATKKAYKYIHVI